jgi:hypothetical protein
VRDKVRVLVNHVHDLLHRVVVEEKVPRNDDLLHRVVKKESNVSNVANLTNDIKKNKKNDKNNKKYGNYFYIVNIRYVAHTKGYHHGVDFFQER